MARGYVAIKEKARRNQEVAAVRDGRWPGKPDLTSNWNAHEKGFKKRVPKEVRLIMREVAMENMQDFIGAVAAIDKKREVRRGFVPKRLD
jgi:hypothetical protein